MMQEATSWFFALAMVGLTALIYELVFRHWQRTVVPWWHRLRRGPEKAIAEARGIAGRSPWMAKEVFLRPGGHGKLRVVEVVIRPPADKEAPGTVVRLLPQHLDAAESRRIICGDMISIGFSRDPMGPAHETGSYLRLTRF